MDVYGLESRKQITAQSGFPLLWVSHHHSFNFPTASKRKEQKVFLQIQRQYNRRNARKLHNVKKVRQIIILWFHGKEKSLRATMIRDDFTQCGIWLEYSQTGKTQRGGMYGSEAQIRSKETQSIRRQLQNCNVATYIYKVVSVKKLNLYILLKHLNHVKTTSTKHMKGYNKITLSQSPWIPSN